ncbi:MAG TPA: plastocyanin/azurin family copper-binding protein, partial [Actinomycetota bacterium]|nr:plastocyanin/azurin family copper-binding protein [Actinomycetota bacterium]
MPPRSPVARAAAAAAVVTLLALSQPAAAVDKTVKMKDNFFTPVYIVVTVGDTVTWVNDGTDRHTVTSFDSAPEAFDSSPGTHSVCDDGNPLTDEGPDCIPPGGSHEETFNEPGTYNYFCKAHGNQDKRPTGVGAQVQPCDMCGQIVVKKKAAPPPINTRSPRRE